MLKLSLEKCARQNSRRKDTRATVGTKTLRPAVLTIYSTDPIRFIVTAHR